MAWIFGGFMMAIAIELIIGIARNYEPREDKPRRQKR